MHASIRLMGAAPRLAAFLTGLALALAASPARAALDAVATTPELAALVREIGGDAVRVTAIAKPLQDPHYLDAKPSFMVTLNRADALFFTGLELEVGWLPLLIQGARNPDLLLVDLSAGVNVLQKPSGAVSRAEGDVHPEGNPHYWLDPRNGAVIAGSIAAALKRADPANTAAYDQRLTAFRQKAEAKLAEWRTALAPFKGSAVLDYHTTWLYFADWADLRIVNQVEAKPGIPPTPGHIQTVMAQIERERVRLLLQPNFVNPKVGEFLARRTGIQVLSLPATVGGEPGTDTWFDFFDKVVSHAATALK